MVTTPGDYRRTLTGRETITLAAFAVLGAAIAFIQAYGGLV